MDSSRHGVVEVTSSLIASLNSGVVWHPLLCTLFWTQDLKISMILRSWELGGQFKSTWTLLSFISLNSLTTSCTMLCVWGHYPAASTTQISHRRASPLHHLRHCGAILKLLLYTQTSVEKAQTRNTCSMDQWTYMHQGTMKTESNPKRNCRWKVREHPVQ